VFALSVSPVPLQVNSISNSVYMDLKKQILEGTLQPGERLIVLDISGRYQISQAPVREALERLKQEGLIVGQMNKGSVVSNITDKEIKDLFVLREIIEGFAVRESMPLLTEADYRYLEQVLAEMEAANEAKDNFKILEKDMEFHGFFYNRCNNGAILDIWNQMQAKIMRFMAISNRYYTTDGLAAWHMRLIEALKTGDAIEAEKRFIEHMQAYKMIHVN